MVRQYEVYWTDLRPPRGSECGKVRPCIVVSPDELNDPLSTVVVVPLTSVVRGWPFRCGVELNGKRGEACIDQIRVIDKTRLKQKAGDLGHGEVVAIKEMIREMYVD
jgi:mRNA interferase MazF